MEEQVISYEVAKLLKQIGFSIECERHYTEIDNWLSLSKYKTNHNKYEGLYSAPSQEMAKYFLREEYLIHVEVLVCNEGWEWVIKGIRDKKYTKYSKEYYPNEVKVWDEYEDALNDVLEKVCLLIIDEK